MTENRKWFCAGFTMTKNIKTKNRIKRSLSIQKAKVTAI